MKKLLFSLSACIVFSMVSCDTLQSVANNLPSDLMNTSSSGGNGSNSGGNSGGCSYNSGIIPSESSMASALKEALSIGSNSAANALHQPGGYLDNPRFKIPFPPEVQNVADKLRAVGMGAQVDKFIESMNRGAEDAAIKAAPIFVDAIKSMTLTDAKNILLGADNSATNYFKAKTSNALYQSFSPVIKTSLDKVSATKYWTQITTAYNKIPFVKPVQTDLVKYTTDKALDGLFLRVSDEEKSIRTNIKARTTDQLKNVFGWAASLKK